MSENNQPGHDPLETGKQSEVPAGYDQPATPAYGDPIRQQPAAPSYQQPAAPAAPSYQQPYPGVPQGYPQQNVQQNPYQQNPYPQPGAQQGYQQPGFGYGYAGVEQKSKIVAGILGILLGSLGVHRFYLGNTKMGVIQLIVTFVTFGVGGIWGFIEGIMILVGADPFKTDAHGIPLKD